MKKMLLYFSCIICILLITSVFIASARDIDSINAEFLAQYGWKVMPKSIEYEKVTLPSREDEVYKNYNKLQKEAGLDLSLHYSHKAERFTYIVLNYPYPTQGQVRANVLCVNQKPIAGDIMTVASDGFMHSLKFPE